MTTTGMKKTIGFAVQFGTLLSLLVLSGCELSQPTNKTSRPPVVIQKDLLTVNPVNYSRAYNTFHAEAQAGDPIAQNNLAQMYADGRGVKADPVKALYWYTKSAEQGFAPAEVNLGVAYLYGLGVKEDKQTACNYFNEAVAHRNRDGYDFYKDNCKIA